MTWFYISLIAPFLWSLVNHAEKFLLSNSVLGGGASTLMIFIGGASLPICMMIISIDHSVLDVTLFALCILIISGFVYGLASFVFLHVLESNDASYVVPLWQLTPIFSYLFGILFLNEFLSSKSILGSLIVIIGALLLSYKTNNLKILFDISNILKMMASSALLALSFVLFKFGEAPDRFLTAIFWNQIGLIWSGLLFLFDKNARSSASQSLSQNSLVILIVNLVTQVIDVLAVIAANFALRFAPAALVVLIEYAAQPFFVFLFGIGLTKLVPRYFQEDIDVKTLVQRGAAIAVMSIGVSVILLS